MKISELKQEAKIKLSGNFKLAFVINLLHLLITLGLAFLAEHMENIFGLILLLVTAILSIPLGYGLTASMLKLSRNEETAVTDFIKLGFQNFKKALFLTLSIFVRLIVPIILVIVASILPIVEAFMAQPGEEGSNILSIFALVLIVASIIYLFYKCLAYTLCTYILVDNPEAKSKEVIKTSSKLMKGNKLKFIGLVLSFFGWILLCGVISGFIQAFNATLGTIVTYLTSLILTPYITFAEINFYESLANPAVPTAQDNNQV